MAFLHFSCVLFLALSVPTRALSDTNGLTTSVPNDVLPDEVASGLMPVPIYPFAVHKVAFHPRGEMLATGNGSGVVQYWNPSTGEAGRPFSAHSNWVFSLTWTKDGTGLITGGGDNLVKVFRLGKGESRIPSEVFEGHTMDVHAVVEGSGGTHLVSGGDDRQIIVWNVETRKALKQWKAHERPVTALAMHPRKSLVASASRDHSIKLWDWQTGKLVDALIGHTGDVMAVAFSEDGQFLASAGYDKSVRLWDVRSGKCIRIFLGHEDRVFGVAFAPAGNQLASVGDQSLAIWDRDTGALEKRVTPHGKIKNSSEEVHENISSLSYSPDGKTIAIGSTSGNTYLVSSMSGEILRTLTPELNAPSSNLLRK